MMKRRIALLLVLLASTAACGDEAESAPGSRPAAFGQPLNPWDTIPPDSLYGATPAENLRVTPVELDVLGLPAGWEGLRVAAISDLQLDLWSGNPEVAQAAIEAAVAIRPDLVVLLGDYLGNGSDPAPLRRLLTPLSGLPTFAVLGDRDVRSDSLAANIAATLSAAGVRVLRNEAVALERGGDTMTVAGVDAELLGDSGADQAWILSQLGLGRPIGLLISHNAILAARADEDRVSAAVAGGIHCARVEVPGTPRLSWLNEQGLPGAAVDGAERLYRIGPMVMFVTCGVGYGFIPARFGHPPEVALITLRGVGGGGMAADSAAPDTLLQQFEESLADTAQ